LFVADKQSKDSHELLYCGFAAQGSGTAINICVGYDHHSIAYSFPLSGERYTAPVSSEDVEETKN